MCVCSLGLVGLVRNVKVKGSLGCGDCEMVEVEVFGTVMRTHNKLAAMAFRRADFGLFKDLLGRVPWGRTPEGSGAQESMLIFKDSFFQVWEQCIPTKRKKKLPQLHG